MLKESWKMQSANLKVKSLTSPQNLIQLALLLCWRKTKQMPLNEINWTRQKLFWSKKKFQHLGRILKSNFRWLRTKFVVWVPNSRQRCTGFQLSSLRAWNVKMNLKNPWWVSWNTKMKKFKSSRLTSRCSSRNSSLATIWSSSTSRTKKESCQASYRACWRSRVRCNRRTWKSSV